MLDKLQERACTLSTGKQTLRECSPISEEFTPRTNSYKVQANVQGIGPILTSWVGMKGVSNIADKLAQSQESEKIKTLTRDLKLLANSCHSALKTAGLLDTSIPEIQNAVELCKKYTSEQGSARSSTNSCSQIAQLWKKNRTENSALDPEKRAQEILGTHLTNSVLERTKEPPNVSACIYAANSITFYHD